MSIDFLDILEFCSLSLADIEQLTVFFPESHIGNHRLRLEKLPGSGYGYYCLKSPNGIIAAIGLIRRQGPINPAARLLSGYPEIANLFVREDFRRQGLAKRLLSELEIILQCEGYEAVGLAVKQDNTAAYGLYTSSGYRKVATLSNSPNDTRRDYMLKKLQLEDS